MEQHTGQEVYKNILRLVIFKLKLNLNLYNVRKNIA